MNIMRVSRNVNFSACLPVRYYAMTDEGPRKLVKEQQIRRCNRQVVKHLNCDPDKILEKNKRYITLRKYIADVSPEYKKENLVATAYSYTNVFLLTGNDAKANKAAGKKIGVAISKTRENEGRSTGPDVKAAQEEWYINKLIGLNYGYESIKNKNNEDLVLKIYFQPKYKKNGDIKSFDLISAKFVTREEYLKSAQRTYEYIVQQERKRQEEEQELLNSELSIYDDYSDEED